MKIRMELVIVTDDSEAEPTDLYRVEDAVAATLKLLKSVDVVDVDIVRIKEDDNKPWTQTP
jgi:hypothetical protein